MHILNKQELKEVTGGATLIEYALLAAQLSADFGISDISDFSASDTLKLDFLVVVLADEINGITVTDANVYGGNPMADTISGAKLIKLDMSDGSKILFTDKHVLVAPGGTILTG